MSFLVVEFVDEHEVAVISHRWYLGEQRAMWPTVRPAQFRRLLRAHLIPDEEQYVIYDVKILRRTGKPCL